MGHDMELSELSIDDVKEGDSFDLDEYQMERDEIIAFASKYDPQPYHLSDEATVGHPIFKGMSASGWHSVMVTQLMLSAFWQKTKVRGLAGGSVGGITWIMPVYPGDLLRGRVVIPMIRRSQSRPERALITMDVTLRNQDEAEVLKLSITGVFKA